MNNNQLNDQQGGVYSTPVAKSIVLDKHQAFANQISQTFQTMDDSPILFY